MATIETKPRHVCFGCDHWRQTKAFTPAPGQSRRLQLELAQGECRAAAPQGVRNEYGELRAHWPLTGGADWCAAHLAAP